MSEHCEVHFTKAAKKELATLAKKDPQRALIIEATVAQVEENGWKLSTKAEVVKVLHNNKCIGEIRDVGSGGYRLLFFWHISVAARELWVCRVLPKRAVEGTRRLNELCDSVARLRERFLKENE
jgi:mRNA-degrading endonuclease RelE of RelBE toxin-antitoxin system